MSRSSSSNSAISPSVLVTLAHAPAHACRQQDQWESEPVLYGNKIVL